MAKTFLVSDDSLNSYGFRVLTSGIQLDNFLKNPVGFFNHNCCEGDLEYLGPIIRWENLQADKVGLQADAVFDVNDPFGKAISDKVENNFLRAASIGFRILKTSEDPADMLPGQLWPTVTKCELIEISVVDIPANKNALACYDADGKKIELSDEAALMQCLKAKSKNAVRAVEDRKNLKDDKMKLTILKAWAALSAFLSIKHADNTDATETEITQDQLADLNTRVARLNELETELQSAKDVQTELVASHNASVTSLNDQINSLRSELAAAQAEVVALKKPVTAPTTPVKKDGDTTLGDEAELDEVTKAAIKLKNQYK